MCQDDLGSRDRVRDYRHCLEFELRCNIHHKNHVIVYVNAYTVFHGFMCTPQVATVMSHTFTELPLRVSPWEVSECIPDDNTTGDDQLGVVITLFFPGIRRL